MRRREHQHHEDQLSFAWQTPRPLYMREIEPLAHDDAWPSPIAHAGVEKPLLTPEQLENRAILMAGQKRKQPNSEPSAISSQPAERKMG
jgi:hypothetical protein